MDHWQKKGPWGCTCSNCHSICSIILSLRRFDRVYWRRWITLRAGPSKLARPVDFYLETEGVRLLLDIDTWIPLDLERVCSPNLPIPVRLRPLVSWRTVRSCGGGGWVCWERGESSRVGQVDCLVILTEQGVDSLRSVRGVAKDMGVILVRWAALLRKVICISINIISRLPFIVPS